MKARLQTRFFAATTDLTSPDTAVDRWYGNCPVWARKAAEGGLVVASETVLVIGTREPCVICGGAHLPVPPPWSVS